jgi:hypothetical protein
LQDKVRAQQQKKNQEKDDVDCRNNHQPTEVMFLRAAKLHALRAVPILAG